MKMILVEVEIVTFDRGIHEGWKQLVVATTEEKADVFIQKWAKENNGCIAYGHIDGVVNIRKVEIEAI